MALEPILDVWGVHGEIITLEYHRRRSIVDLYPFFKNQFSQRDKSYMLGEPKFARAGGSENIPQFYFTLEHFFETYLDSYTTMAIAAFLEYEMDLYQPQAADFLGMIRNVEQTHRFVRRKLCTSMIYDRITPWYFEPINFKFEELGISIPQSMQPRRKPRQHGTESSSPLIRERFAPWHFREQLLHTSPPTIILSGIDSPALDYFSLIKRYDLPTDHLEIVKKST